jgi:hypothetical protein
MPKRIPKSKRGPKVPANSDKNLPALIFRDFTRLLLMAEVKTLPPSFEPQDFARLVLRYLEYAKKRISVPFKNTKLSVSAQRIVEDLGPRWLGPNFEVLDQEDYKSSVLPLLDEDNLRHLQPLILKLRLKARELTINWPKADSVVRDTVTTLCLDNRPLKVQRGEIRDRVVAELGQIKANRPFKDFEDLQKSFGHFEVVRILAEPRFIDDDRSYLASPSKWETKHTTYAHGILGQHWGVGEESLRGYRRALHASSPQKRQNPKDH